MHLIINFAAMFNGCRCKDKTIMYYCQILDNIYVLF